jgi:hypothetical protein
VIDGAPSIVGPSKAEAESGPRRDAAEPVDATPGASGPSIAVLPFDNFGCNAEGGRIFAVAQEGERSKSKRVSPSG